MKLQSDMNQNIEAFTEAIDKKVDYFRKEYNMTLAESVGVLEVVTHALIQEEMEG